MVYSISEIKDILGVSRTKAYEYRCCLWVPRDSF